MMLMSLRQRVGLRCNAALASLLLVLVGFSPMRGLAAERPSDSSDCSERVVIVDSKDDRGFDSSRCAMPEQTAISTQRTISAKGGLPELTVRATSNGGVGSFVFSGNNGWSTQTITTISPGVAVAGTAQTLAAAASTTITAAVPAGFLMTSANCTGMGGGGSATLAGNSLTLDAAAASLGAVISCSFTFVRQPTLTLTAVSNGGVGAFTFTGNNGWLAQTITTTTPGIAVAGATQVLTLPGLSTTITAATPPGYVVTGASCSGMGPGGVAVLAGNSLTLNAAAISSGANVVCTFTFVKLPTLTVTAVSNGGVGVFTYSGTNGWTNQIITTTSPGVGVSGASQTLAAAGTSTSITATLPPGYLLVGASCTGMGSGGTATLIGNTLLLNAAATSPGANIACTNTFAKQPTLTLTAISQGGVGTFTFSGNNGWSNQLITTTVPGVGVAGATQVLTLPSVVTAITETSPPGFFVTGGSCTGLGSGGTATFTGSTLTLNAAATAAGANIVCTFTNELPPSLSITDSTVTEGNTGAVNATFIVSLSAASSQTVSVSFATADSTATQPSDYTSTSGALVFSPGQTALNISVPVNGDIVPESDETFVVNLSGAVNASLADAQGAGLISNDDVPVAINPSSLPNGSVAATYNQLLIASGGASPYTFAVTSGSLPAGLMLSPAGGLTGTPSAGGSFSVIITATDSSPFPGPFSGSQSYLLIIDPPLLALPSTALPTGSVGTAYASAITPASGGTAPYSYAVTTGALPSGLTLDAFTGAITGLPNAAGTANFAITATDSSTGTGPYSTSQTYALMVAAPTLTLAPAAGTLVAPYNTAFAQSFATGGGIGPYTYALTGALPAGLSFAGDTISGVPTATGSFSIAITATDTGSTGAGSPFSITQNYVIDVPPPSIVVDPTTLPGSTAGLFYSQTLSATGGASPYTFSVSAGSLPTGLVLSSGGVLSGTITASGSFSFTVTALDTHGQSGSRAYTIVVAAPAMTLNPASLPGGTAGVAYSQALSIAGGLAPYSITQTGALPTGMTFDASTLSFTGVPTQSGSFNLSVTVVDSTLGTPASVTNAYSLVIGLPSLTLSPAAGALPAAVGGVPYIQTFSASGGVAPYTYAVVAGVLPAGLMLNSSTGVLSGNPTATGMASFSIQATDSTSGSAATVVQAYTLAVSAPSISIGPTTLPAGVVAQSYHKVLTATGGSAPYTFAVTAGALPAGLSLSPSGVLSGTPTAPGPASFTVTVTDASGFTGGAPYTMGIVAVPRPVPSQTPAGSLMLLLAVLGIGLATRKRALG